MTYPQRQAELQKLYNEVSKVTTEQKVIIRFMRDKGFSRMDVMMFFIGRNNAKN